MTTKMSLHTIGFVLLASAGAVACTADGLEEDDAEDVGTQASAQAKDTTPSKEGGGCTATSTIRSTTVSNGTYTSNGNGGYNCCSKAGPNQVCINCDATGTNSCTDKASTFWPTWGYVAPAPTVIYASP